MAIISGTSTQIRTITVQCKVPDIGVRATGTAIEKKRRQHA